MQQLQDADIYLLLDLANPSTSINRDTPTWNPKQHASYAVVVDAFHNYTNVLGFLAGNEVANNGTNTNASGFVKAAIRDMKAYMKQKDYRAIPVGYATNDDAEIREDLGAYFDCGDVAEQADFLGYNIYSWCGDSSFVESGYEVRTEQFAKYSIPAFFSEYGCNVPSPRQFKEVQAIYGSQMTPVWSGGIVYNYFQQDNDFGMLPRGNI